MEPEASPAASDAPTPPLLPPQPEQRSCAGGPPALPVQPQPAPAPGFFRRVAVSASERIAGTAVTIAFWLVVVWVGSAVLLGPDALADKIVIIDIDSEISASRSVSRLGEPDFQEWMDTFARTEADERCKAVVVRLNTPGGTAAASHELYQAIKRLRARGIRVVASLADIAASGGYYVAAAAEKIVANPATLTGSIGVIVSFPTAGSLLSKVGVRYEIVKSGKMKDLGNFSRDATEEERALFQSLVDRIFGQFVSAVSEGRGMPRKKVESLADGRIYTGLEAYEVGLVDQLGSEHDAVDLARTLARLPKDAPVRRAKGGGSFLRSFLSGAFSGALPGARDFAPEVLLDGRLLR